MISLYTWTTPNGRKASIMLEETGLAYEVRPIDIGRDEQFAPDFLRVSPNNKIPAIVDHDAPGGPLALFESGAILTYLADKTGQLLAPSGAARWKALEWMSWQIGGLGPILGQLGYFANRAKERVPHAIDRFTEESNRLLDVMERRLADVPYLAGEDYTIADIACYAWTDAVLNGPLKAPLNDPAARRPAIARWRDTIAARPAVQRGMAIPQV